MHCITQWHYFIWTGVKPSDRQEKNIGYPIVHSIMSDERRDTPLGVEVHRDVMIRICICLTNNDLGLYL